jgi:hypothetical protein
MSDAAAAPRGDAVRRSIAGVLALLAAGAAPASRPAGTAGAARRAPVPWIPVEPGLDTASVALEGPGPLGMIRLVMVRLDPARLTLHLVESYHDAGTRGAWTTDSLPAAAVFAANAGQFRGGVPWGWLLREGIERKPRGTGSLAMDVVLDSPGGAFLHASSAGMVPAGAREGFQSYPMLLDRGEVPPPLAAPGRGIDLEHRDSRLALGRFEDGRLLFVLTRVARLGEAGERLPLGPTVPEMAEIMSWLLVRDAVLLDGGISSQMAVRDRRGRFTAWGNWRPVPLAIVAEPGLRRTDRDVIGR